jgi:hypothetical protein
LVCWHVLNWSFIHSQSTENRHAQEIASMALDVLAGKLKSSSKDHSKRSPIGNLNIRDFIISS